VRVVTADELLDALRRHSGWRASETPREREKDMAMSSSAHSTPGSAGTHAPPNRDAHPSAQVNNRNVAASYYPFKNPLKAVPSFAKSASSQVLSATCPGLLINMPTTPPLSIYDLHKPPVNQVSSPTYTASAVSTRDMARPQTKDKDHNAGTYAHHREKLAGNVEVLHVRHDDLSGTRPKTSAAHTRYGSMVVNQSSNTVSFNPHSGGVPYDYASGIGSKEDPALRLPAKSVYFGAQTTMRDSSVQNVKERGTGGGVISVENLNDRNKEVKPRANASGTTANDVTSKVSSQAAHQTPAQGQYVHHSNQLEGRRGGVPTAQFMSRKLPLTVCNIRLYVLHDVCICLM
jgi:hypothetical protein